MFQDAFLRMSGGFSLNSILMLAGFIWRDPEPDRKLSDIKTKRGHLVPITSIPRGVRSINMIEGIDISRVPKNVDIGTAMDLKVLLGEFQN